MEQKGKEQRDGDEEERPQDQPLKELPHIRIHLRVAVFL